MNSHTKEKVISKNIFFDFYSIEIFNGKFYLLGRPIMNCSNSTISISALTLEVFQEKERQFKRINDLNSKVATSTFAVSTPFYLIAIVNKFKGNIVCENI